MQRTIQLFKSIDDIQNKWRVIAIILCSISLSLIQVFIGDTARRVIDNDILSTQMFQMVLLFAVVTVAGMFLIYMNISARNNLGIEISESLRSKLLSKITVLHTSFFSTAHSGKLGYNLFLDTEKISAYFSGPLLEMMENSILFIVSFIYLLSINPTMTLVVVISIPLTIVFTNRIVDPLFRTISDFGEKMDEASSLAKDTVMGMDIVKAYNLEKERTKTFDTVIDEAIKHYVRYEKYVAISGPIRYIINALPIFVYIIMAFFQFNKGNVTGGELMAFTYLLRMISKPLSSLPAFITEHVTTLAYFERYNAIMVSSEEVGGTERGSLEASNIFELEAMSFAYADDKENLILNNIDLIIEKGKTVAFVGASGCGKSTMFKLLSGQYYPTGGEMRFNGKDIKSWDLNWLREQISFVGQESYLFPISVAENIGYGDKDAQRKDIEAAAKAAGAHEFIQKMPQGYDTIISEDGSNLSGGQKQRLSIARALLKNAPIFMLDEMTSALDYETESHVQNSIESLGKDKTVIIIAHRLSTVINADEIIVFDRGGIVERGDHESLIKCGGAYAKLYETQIVEA